MLSLTEKKDLINYEAIEREMRPGIGESTGHSHIHICKPLAIVSSVVCMVAKIYVRGENAWVLRNSRANVLVTTCGFASSKAAELITTLCRFQF